MLDQLQTNSKFFQANSHHFDATSKSTKCRSNFWGIDSIVLQNDGNQAPDWVQEFRLSAIPDRLTLANVSWIAGDEAIEILTETKISEVQSSTSFVGVEAGRILKNAGYIRAGGWCAWGTTLEHQTANPSTVLRLQRIWSRS